MPPVRPAPASRPRHNGCPPRRTPGSGSSITRPVAADIVEPRLPPPGRPVFGPAMDQHCERALGHSHALFIAMPSSFQCPLVQRDLRHIPDLCHGLVSDHQIKRRLRHAQIDPVYPLFFWPPPRRRPRASTSGRCCPPTVFQPHPRPASRKLAPPCKVRLGLNTSKGRSAKSAGAAQQGSQAPCECQARRIARGVRECPE